MAAVGSAPIFFLSVGLRALPTGPLRVGAALLAAGVLIAANGRSLMTRYPGDAEVRPLTARVLDLWRATAAGADRRIVLHADEADEERTTGILAGVMVELKRLGVGACTDAYRWAYVFTSDRICTPEEVVAKDLVRIQVLPRASCADLCVGTTAGWGVRPAPTDHRAVVGQVIAFSDPATTRYRGDGWSGVEPWGVWTERDSADLFLDVEGASGPDVEVVVVYDLNFWPGEAAKTIRVLVNGVEADRWSFKRGQADGAGRIRIPARAPVHIRFAGLLAEAGLRVRSLTRRAVSLGVRSLTVEPVGSNSTR
jgi:hypothetical protein